MTPGPKATIHDVAKAAGVSTKTVSRVTNGEDSVAAETVRRVQAAIDELGYRVNPLARSLRTGRDDAIAVIVTTIADPFFASIVDSVEAAAREAGWFMLVAATGRTASEGRAVVNGVLHRRVRGLIIVPSQLDYGAAHLPLGAGGVPVVFVDRPPVNMPGDVVMIDNVATARRSAEHLISYGHRRIAFAATGLDATGAGEYPLVARLNGYKEALAAHELPFDPGLVLCHDLETGAEAPLLESVLAGDDPATAVLCGNVLASLDVVADLRRAGRSDVAIVSFDDFPMADALTPGITVVRQDPVLMGRRAFELLRERIEGDREPPRTVILPTAFIERGSGELRPPARDVPIRARSTGGRKQATKPSTKPSRKPATTPPTRSTHA
jgi:LacI family transcriptional regulator